MLRWLATLALMALLAFAGAYVLAGRAMPPRLTIDQPDRSVGQLGTIEITAEAPIARLTALTVTLEQNGRTTPLFSLDSEQTATVTTVDPNRLHVSRPFGKQRVPELQAGAARLVVSAPRRAV